MEAMNKPDSRKQRSFKNILINPGYQLRYTFWLSASGLVLIALNAAVFYIYVRENYAILVDLSPMTDDAKAQLYSELDQILIKLTLLSCGFLAALSTLGIFFSHRTAGPLYHFKRVFNQIRSGDVKARIRLRPKDDFQDVAESFNTMIDEVTTNASAPRDR